MVVVGKPEGAAQDTAYYSTILLEMSKMDVYLPWGPSGLVALFMVACTFLLPIVGLLFVVKRKVSKRRVHSAQAPSETAEPEVLEPTTTPPLDSTPPLAALAAAALADVTGTEPSPEAKPPTNKKPELPDDVDMDFNFAKVKKFRTFLCQAALMVGAN